MTRPTYIQVARGVALGFLFYDFCSIIKFIQASLLAQGVKQSRVIFPRCSLPITQINNLSKFYYRHRPTYVQTALLPVKRLHVVF